MAYDDSPIVDDASRYSERSELKFRHFLNQESGFICRTEVPDKGADFNVELILNNRLASGWKFPIQLKSDEKISLIRKGEFITYSFETSRLRYLMQTIPYAGIIVVYSVENETCYYEFADKVYNRLMQERDSEDWKRNDKVSVHIPFANSLNEGSAATIHQTMLYRFERAKEMHESLGPKYGLPSLTNLTKDFEYDFRNADHVVTFLELHGLSLLTNYDIGMIFQMISQIPHRRIYQNETLLVIAAVAYSESNFPGESQVFCEKAKKLSFSLENDLTLKFTGLKNQLALGYISDQDFLLELRTLDRLNLGGQNGLTIRINIIRYELINLTGLTEIPETLLTSIDKIFEDIRTSELDDRPKDMYMLWNCENLIQLAFSIMTSTLGDFQMREAMKETVSVQERRSAAIRHAVLEERINAIIAEVNKRAETRSDNLVRTNAYTLDIRYFLQFQTNLILFDSLKGTMNAERLLAKITNATLTYNSFITLALLKEAYDALCTLLELVELAEGAYLIDQPRNKTQLYEAKQKFELDLQIDPREIEIAKILTKKKGDIENSKSMSYCKDLNDEQITFVAKTALNSFKLPPERLVNIIDELKAYRLFYQRCTDSNIEVIQVKTLEDYSVPIRYCLVNKVSTIRSLAEKDMDYLLKSWGY